MKIAILITAHKNKTQLLRLINHLKTSFDVYVHIDKKSKMNLEVNDDNVFIYKEIVVTHSGITQITSSIILFRNAIKRSYDRYIFISGQDLPIKSNKYILDFFVRPENKDKEFILCSHIDKNHKMYQDMTNRYNMYNFGLWYRKMFHKSIRLFISNLPFMKRQLPDYDIYYGSNWFNLTHNALKYFLDYIDENKSYFDRYNYTYIGDEMIINSVLMNR